MKNNDKTGYEMKIKAKYNHWIPRLLQVEGIVLFPFMLFANDHDYYIHDEPRIMRHELRHVYQIRVEGVLTFYIKYLINYLRNLVTYRNHFNAYWNIWFEIDARSAESKILDRSTFMYLNVSL